MDDGGGRMEMDDGGGRMEREVWDFQSQSEKNDVI